MRRAKVHCLLMISILSVGGLTACATNFTGAAHFPGGVAGCATRCNEQGLESVAFVYAGDYSTACVCQTKSAASLGHADTTDAVAAPPPVSSEVSEASEPPSAAASGAESANSEATNPIPTKSPESSTSSSGGSSSAAPVSGGPVKSQPTPIAPQQSGSGRRGQ